MKGIVLSKLLNLALIGIIFTSCATKAKIVGNFTPNHKVIDKSLYDEVIVSGFNYSSMRQTSRPAGSYQANGYVTNYYEVVKEYSNGDISMQIADMLKSNGVNARALKKAGPENLGSRQILLTGNVQLYNWGSFKGWEVVPFFVGLGNILPAPWGFRVGAQINYSTEVINSSGEILYQVPQKSGRASYNHLWIWGAMTFSKRDFEKSSDILGTKAFNEILSVFGTPEHTSYGN
jgi:hypothetical protein